MDTIGTCRALALAGTCLATLASGAARAADTATPVRHLIVVFQENVPFDHYFATYPGTAPFSGRRARTVPGEPAAAPPPAPSSS